jgi:AAHS family 4-hydroxybenzoate transporter-like MFS transporter
MEIDDLIDARPLSGLQKYVMFLCALAVLFDGYDLQVMALTVPALSKAWALAPSNFSTALSASLLGMGLGAAFIGPLGDRYGRRRTGRRWRLSASRRSLRRLRTTSQLALSPAGHRRRLGASLANAYTLTADFMPDGGRPASSRWHADTSALRPRCTYLVFNSVGGRHSSLAAYCPAAQHPAGCAAPESIKFLLHRRRRRGHCRYLAQDRAALTPRRSISSRGQSSEGSIRGLFARPPTTPTLLMWLGFAMNSFNLYLLVSWLPTLLTGAGWTPTQAIQAVSFNSLGGIIGGVSLAWMMDRFGAERTLSAGCIVNAIALSLFLVVPSGFLSCGAFLLVIGACTGGTVLIVSLAAMLHPPASLLPGRAGHLP